MKSDPVSAPDASPVAGMGTGEDDPTPQLPGSAESAPVLSSKDHDRECLKAGRTVDGFLNGAVIAQQPAKGYRAGLDAVLLAAAVPVGATGGALRVLDAGAGAGVVALCVAARVPGAQLTMVEQDLELAGLARDNATRNGWSDRINVLQGDVTAPVARLVERGLQLESFDHVVTNPPYYTDGSGTPSSNRLKAGSNSMASGRLDQWIRFAAAVARPRGTVTVVYRADGLDDLLQAMSQRFGGLAVLPVHPRSGVAAHRIIVRGVKGSRAPLKLLPGLILHEADNSLMPDVSAILLDGALLPLT